MNLVLAYAVSWFGNFFIALLVARALMTWIPFNPSGMGGKLFAVLSALTEPIVSPVRRIVQRSPLGGPGMMLDFSPMLTMLAIYVITTSLSNFLRTM